MNEGQQSGDQDGSAHLQPGETISPRTATPTTPTPPAAMPSPMPEAVPLPPAATLPEDAFPRSVAAPPTGPDGGITWTASEFIAHSKSVGWYALLASGAVVLAAIIWLLTKDMISTVVVLIAGGAFGLYAGRQPRELSYHLDGAGLTIGSRSYVYQQFRSFATMQEGAFSSIVFVPLKRFAPLITIYYDPSDEEKIIDLLSERLPNEERRHDLVDRLMWRIRF